MVKDRIAIITGGTSGIGLATVQILLQEGAKVYFLGSQLERGKELEIAYQQQGMPAYFKHVTLPHTKEIEKTFQEILEKENTVDILINNAGITRDHLLLKMTEEMWDEVIDVNLKSCFLTVKAVLRTMMKQRSGRIINVSSVVGLYGNLGQANYAASKAGMIGFTKALAKELGSRNILVNAIAPGFIKTQMTEGIDADTLTSQIPLGRMGTPEEVASLIVFLAGSHASYITGQVFTIDGGLTLL